MNTTAPAPFQLAFRHDVGLDLRFLIARVTGAPVHVASFYGVHCYEAAFSGMRAIYRHTRLQHGRWELLEPPVTAPIDPGRGLALAKARLGWNYDWLGAIVAWWLGRPGGRGVATRIFCSEEAADELLAMGVPLFYRRTAHYTPRLLRDELLARGWRSRWYVPPTPQLTEEIQ